MEFEGFDPKLGKINTITENGKLYPSYEPALLPLNINYNSSLAINLANASGQLGNLNGAGHLLTNPHMFIFPYLRKEAVLSSKIEGTKTTLSEVLIHEADPQKLLENKDLSEVLNYIKALEYGLNQIQKRDIDISLIKDLHRILMSGVRGKDKEPGEFRRIQNFIGTSLNILDARFVPPHPAIVPQLMENLVAYINSDSTDHPLIKAALMHYQFETIHPFRDGNGRMGRLMIILFLCKNKIIERPLLYLSAYFEKDTDLYCNHLLNVSKKGNLADWLDYFLKGVETQAHDALKRAIELEKYREECRKLLQTKTESINVLTALDLIFENPYVTLASVKDRLKYYSTAARAINLLLKHKILVEIKNPVIKKGRLYYSPKVKEIMSV